MPNYKVTCRSKDKKPYDNIMKSFLLGFIIIIKSLLEQYGQFFVCATKKDQASIVVREVKKLLDMSENCVKDRFTIYGKASISKIVSETTLSEIAPLSADHNTLDGLGVDLAKLLWSTI